MLGTDHFASTGKQIGEMWQLQNIDGFRFIGIDSDGGEHYCIIRKRSGKTYMDSNTIVFQDLIGWVPDTQAPNAEVSGRPLLACPVERRVSAQFTMESGMTFENWWRSKYPTDISEIEFMLLREAWNISAKTEREAIAREAKELGGAITVGAILLRSNVELTGAARHERE